MNSESKPESESGSVSAVDILSHSIEVIVGPMGKMPFRKRATDAGYDLFASDTAVLAPGEQRGIRTDVRFRIPVGKVALIMGRSSLPLVRPLLDVIDATYTGEIVPRMTNESDEDFVIACGDRFAQIVFLDVPSTHLRLVEEFQINEGDRGTLGYGHSGK